MKDFPAGLLLTSLPWIVGRTLGVIPYYIIKGQGKVILKSKIDGIIGIPSMLAKRRLVRKSVSSSDIRRFISFWKK
jgi:hypothetical protein